MKKGFLLILLTGFSLLPFANIITVSNSVAYQGQFTNISAAVTAAVAGDTIYIFPSGAGNPYNEVVVIDKKLVLIGGGPYSNRVNKLGTWTNRFDLTPTAAGTTIMGIGFETMHIGSNQGTPIVVDAIVITDCQFKNPVHFYCHNLLFQNNIANGINVGNPASMNLVIRNNIINGPVALWGGGTGVVEHNVFANTHNAYAFSYIEVWTGWGSGMTIKNNIFYNVEINGLANNSGSVTAQCAYINNIYFLSNDPLQATPGSSGNLNINPLFANFPAGGASFNIAHDYRLQVSSPGKNYATGGTDVGVWGGSTPVNAYFEPPIPRVIQLEVSNSTVPPGGQIQLTIKATKAQ
jgi:hypothetical protein